MQIADVEQLFMARCLTGLLLLRRSRRETTTTTQHNQPLRLKKARGLQLSQDFRRNFNHRSSSSSCSLSLLLTDSPRLPVNKKHSFSSSFSVGYTTLLKTYFPIYTRRGCERERERSEAELALSIILF